MLEEDADISMFVDDDNEEEKREHEDGYYFLAETFEDEFTDFYCGNELLPVVTLLFECLRKAIPWKM